MNRNPGSKIRKYSRNIKSSVPPKGAQNTGKFSFKKISMPVEMTQSDLNNTVTNSENLMRKESLDSSTEDPLFVGNPIGQIQNSSCDEILRTRKSRRNRKSIESIETTPSDYQRKSGNVPFKNVPTAALLAESYLNQASVNPEHVMRKESSLDSTKEKLLFVVNPIGQAQNSAGDVKSKTRKSRRKYTVTKSEIITFKYASTLDPHTPSDLNHTFVNPENAPQKNSLNLTKEVDPLFIVNPISQVEKAACNNNPRIRKSRRNVKSPKSIVSTTPSDYSLESIAFQNISTSDRIEEPDISYVSVNAENLMQKQSVDSAEEDPLLIVNPISEIQSTPCGDNSMIRKSSRNIKSTKSITSIPLAPKIGNISVKNISILKEIEEPDPNQISANSENLRLSKSLDSDKDDPIAVVQNSTCDDLLRSDSSVKAQDDSSKSIQIQYKGQHESLQNPIEIEDDPACLSGNVNDASMAQENSFIYSDVLNNVIEETEFSRRSVEETNRSDGSDVGHFGDIGVCFDDDDDDDRGGVSEEDSKVVTENTKVISSHLEDKQNSEDTINLKVLYDKSEASNDKEVDILAASRKYFCKFCRKVYINLQFHLDHAHGDEEEVKELHKLPRNSNARKKLAEKIRLDGNRIFNFESNYKEVYLRELNKIKENINTRDGKKYSKCPKCSKRFKSRGFSRHVTYCGARNRKEYVHCIDDDKVWTDLERLVSDLRSEFSRNSWLNIAKCLLTSLHVLNPKVVNIETVLITDFNKRRPFNEEEDLDLKEIIESFKMKHLFAPEVPPKVILQKDLDGMSIVITKNQEEGIDLLLNYRLQANVPKGSPYIFGSPVQHKETHVALLDAMQNYMKEDEVEVVPAKPRRKRNVHHNSVNEDSVPSNTTGKLDDSMVSFESNIYADTSVIANSSPSMPQSLLDAISKYCPIDCSVKMHKLEPEDFCIICKPSGSTDSTNTSSRIDTVSSRSSSTQQLSYKGATLAESSVKTAEFALGNSKFTSSKHHKSPSPVNSLIDLRKSRENIPIEIKLEESEILEGPITSSSIITTTKVTSPVIRKPAISKSIVKKKKIKIKTEIIRPIRGYASPRAKERRKSQFDESPVSVQFSSPVKSDPDQLIVPTTPVTSPEKQSSSIEPIFSTPQSPVKSNVRISFCDEQSTPIKSNDEHMATTKDQMISRGIEGNLGETKMPRCLKVSRTFEDKITSIKTINPEDVKLCQNCNKYFVKISFLKHRKFCMPSTTRKRKRKMDQVTGIVNLKQEDDPRSSTAICPTLQSPAGAKMYFCIFCKQTFTKLNRHLEHIHKDEEEVQEMLKYPKGSAKRYQILYKIRTRGTFTFNMNSEYNRGQLIVSRRPNPKLRRTNGDFLPCPYCGNYFAKKTLYRHTKRCSNGQGYQKNVKRVARALISSIHPRSNKIMATQIIPRLIDDKVSDAIKSDELLVLLGNHLTQKHAAPKGRGYIRQNLRMVGKLLLALKAKNSSITEFSSIFNPDYCDLVIETVMEVAGYVEETNTFKLCDFARKLGAIVKICGEVWSMECCKKKCFEQQHMIVEFLNKLSEAYKRDVYPKLKYMRPQVKPIKQTGELKRLFQFSQIGMLEMAFKLNEDFSLETWVDLLNYLLLHLRLLNNNIHEDGDSLYVSDYLQRHGLDADEDSNTYHSLGLLVNFPKNYLKVRLRESSSSLLLSQEFCGAVDVLLENREDAGVPIENVYLFGKPDDSKLHYRTSEAKSYLKNATVSKTKPNQDVFVPKSEPIDVEVSEATKLASENLNIVNEEYFTHFEADLRKAFDHHTNRMLELRKQLAEKFSNQVWIDLVKCVLTCVQLMNDRTFTEVVQYLLLDDYVKQENIGDDENLDSFNSLKDMCKGFPENFVKINLQGTPIYLLLSSEICNTLDLLIRERTSANIDVENPYVFGCSGNRYNYYRTEGCIGSLPVSNGVEEILALRSKIINSLTKSGTTGIDLSKLLPDTKEDLIDNGTRVFYYSQSKMVELKYKLEEKFYSEIWLDLIKCLLTYIHLLNDRCPEDPERLLIKDYNNRQSLSLHEDSSVYHSSADDLSDFPQNYRKVKVGGDFPHYLLLSLEFCETVDLLLKYRKNAGVHVDNQYVFGCRGSKENFFRAHGAIAQLAPRCGVRCLKYFKAKMVGGAIVTQEQTVEAKVIPKIEKDAYLKKRTYDHNQTLLGASAIKTEDPNANNGQRRRWTDEEMDTARNKFENCLRQGYLPSMYQCQQAISENVELHNRTPEQLKAWVNNQIQKKSGRSRNRNSTKIVTTSTGKQVARCRWSTAEQDIVRLHLGDYLMSRTLPSSAECRKMIASNPEMSHRTPEHVRAWVNNQNKKRNIQ